MGYRYIETEVYKRLSGTQNTYLEMYNKHIIYVFVILFVILISLCILQLLMIEINFFLAETFY